MKNELNRRYIECKEREYEIDKLLDENMNEYLSKPKNEDFLYLDEEYYEWIEDRIEYISEEDPDFKLPDLDKLEEEYEEYMNHLEKSVLNRIELYNRRAENVREFEKWMQENNFIYWDIEVKREDVKEYEGKWYGWSSNDLVNTAMYTTIDYTDEEEVNKVIENAKKVIKYFTKDITYIDEYLYSLDYVNKVVRNGKMEGAEPYFVLDCLENDCVWNIYKEPFSRFVERVGQMVDKDYLDYLKEMECIDNEE